MGDGGLTAETKLSWTGGRQIRLLRIAIGSAALMLIAALLWLPSFAPYLLRFEHWTADWRTAYLADVPDATSKRVALVLIDDATLREYPSSPIDRDLLARLVKAIDTAGATGIGIDVYFLKHTDAAKDAALIEAVRTARARVVLGAIDERGQLQPFQREFQKEFLAKAGRPIGYLNLHHDRDDVVRFTSAPAADGAYPKSFALQLAETASEPSAADGGQPISWLAKPADGTPTFASVTAHELLADPARGAVLKDRIVLIGGDFPNRDRHRIPLTVRDSETPAGVFIHAQIIQGLLEPRRAIAELGPVAVRGVLVLVAIAGFVIGWSLWRSSIVHSLGAGFATALLLAVDAFFFKMLHVLLPFTLALVAWVAGLTAGRSLRFAVPSKRRSQP